MIFLFSKIIRIKSKNILFYILVVKLTINILYLFRIFIKKSRKLKNKEDIREKILDVAQIVFSKHGFDKTTMEEIAKKSEKGKSTLYYYFKNKVELYSAVIEREGNFIMNELMKIINLNLDTKELFVRYITKRFELIEKVVNYFNIVKDDYIKYYPLIQIYRKKHDEFEIIALKQILLKGISRNELNITENQIEDAAIGISSAIKGLEIPLFIESSNNTINKKTDILLELFMHGLLKK